MKNTFLICLSLFTLISFGQEINNYEFVMVPTKFDFQRVENEYRLNTILKYRLEEYGFNASYTSDHMNTNYNDRCLYLNASIVNESTMFSTKLYIVFKDCYNIIIYQSDLGTSKIKDRKDAYQEALENALVAVKSLNYKFTGKKSEKMIAVAADTTTIAVEKTDVVNENQLFAQPIPNGFQLIDTTPKVILKMYKTSQQDNYIATSEGKNGMVFKKGEEWFFEYYANDKLTSEQLLIKF